MGQVFVFMNDQPVVQCERLNICVFISLSVCVQSDPLGLNAAPAEGADGNLGNGQRKRRSSEEQVVGPNSLKRAKVSVVLLSPPRIGTTGVLLWHACLIQAEPTTPISPSTPGAKPWSAPPDDKQGAGVVAPSTPTTPSPAPAPAPAPYRPAV